MCSLGLHDYQWEMYSLRLQEEVVYMLSEVMVKSFSVCGTKFSQLCLQHEVFRDLDKGRFVSDTCNYRYGVMECNVIEVIEHGCFDATLTIFTC